MLLLDAIEQFSRWRQFKVKQNTVSGYNADLKILCLYLHNPDIEKIGLDDVLKHLEEMQNYGWDPQTFVRKCTAFKKFFEFYKMQGFKVIEPELIPVPAKVYKLPRVATSELYQKLIESIPRDDNSRNVRNLAIINLLWDTGARNGEICSLNVSDVDLKEMKAVVRTEKSRGKRPFREIYWTPPTNENLKRWLFKRDSLQTRTKQKVIPQEPDCLFFSLGAGKSGIRMTNKAIGEMLRHVSARSGLDTVNAHSFRHHMGHNIIKKGGSNSDVAGILGHSSLESSFKYTMLDTKELQERHQKFMETD